MTVTKLLYRLQYRIGYTLRDIKWKIIRTIRPAQSWLTRKIPCEWCDKPELIRMILFNILIHYVEEEKGVDDFLDFQSEVDGGYMSQKQADAAKRVNREILDVYTYIKHSRPALDLEIQNAMPEMVNFKSFICSSRADYIKIYGTVNRLQEQMDQEDNWALSEIVKLREYLWT